MSKQRVIKDSFWTDGYIEKLTPDEKLVFLYLLTNPLCNIAGIYEIRTKRMAFETGYDIEVIENILGRFERDNKIIRVDDWIIIVNFAKNQSTNPNVIKGMQRVIDGLPDKVKALEAFQSLSHFTLLNLTIPNLTEIPSEETSQVNLVSELIKEFEAVDTKNKTYYGNKTQRKACEFLISEYGFEEVKSILKILPEVNKRPRYEFPHITTPDELMKNWVKLLDGIHSKQAEIKNKQNKYQIV